MDQYLFKLNKELLDVNALEMDNVLVQFFQNTADNEQIPFIDDTHQSRTLKINWKDRTLEGRGVKGFFSGYDAEYLLIGSTDDGQVKIASPDVPDETDLNPFSHTVESRDRMSEVLHAMGDFQQDRETWFQLYQLAEDFSFNKNQDQLISLPHVREMETYDYQVKTVKSVLTRFKGRALLCDEVGLGKTVEAGIATLEYVMRGLARKILILCPPSLVGQWENEMKRKFNQDFIRADDPAFKKMGNQAWAHCDKVIASLDTAKRKNNSDEISKLHYDLVIADEAHHLKNRKTKAWQFVNAINKKYIFLLTATPVQNNLEELYNLITLLKPGQLKTYRYFRKNFVEGKEGIEAKNVDKLKGLLSEVMIRNKRNNVDVTFTKRQAYTKTVSLLDHERELYDDISTFIRNKYREEQPVLGRFQLKSLQEQMGSTFQSSSRSLDRLAGHDKLPPFDRKALQRFSERARELANQEAESSPKMRQLTTILSDFNDKMLVFTKYKATQSFLAQTLKDKGFKVAEFHGGLPRKEKESQVQYFREEADVLVSTEVGGEGRNLQFCNGMINFDLPWNPMAIEQRIGRIHRIGQPRDVFVYNLVAENTLEHYILNMLDRKINMFELVVGEVDMILGDIEEKEDFSEMIMNAWIDADQGDRVEKEMEKIGDRLLENKKQLLKRKDLDDDLF